MTTFALHIKCVHCDYLTTNLSDLLLHLNIQHTNSSIITTAANFICAHCDYNANNSEEYTQHLKEKHSPTVLVCSFCSHECPDASSMEDHIIVYHNSKLLIDEPQFIEPSKLPAQNALDKQCLTLYPTNISSSTITSKQYTCSICLYKTPSLSDIAHHKKIQHLEKCFPCPICPHTSTTKRALKIHTQKMHEKTKIVCEICGWICSHKSTLNSHKKQQHPPLSSYICHLCDYLVADKRQLLRHLTVSH